MSDQASTICRLYVFLAVGVAEVGQAGTGLRGADSADRLPPLAAHFFLRSAVQFGRNDDARDGCFPSGVWTRNAGIGRNIDISRRSPRKLLRPADCEAGGTFLVAVDRLAKSRLILRRKRRLRGEAQPGLIGGGDLENDPWTGRLLRSYASASPP